MRRLRAAAKLDEGKKGRRKTMQPTHPHQTNATELTVGQWTWTDHGEYGGPALELNGYEVRIYDDVDVADLRQLSLDLMKLANALANRP
jgi:hypothetical protein